MNKTLSILLVLIGTQYSLYPSETTISDQIKQIIAENKKKSSLNHDQKSSKQTSSQDIRALLDDKDEAIEPTFLQKLSAMTSIKCISICATLIIAALLYTSYQPSFKSIQLQTNWRDDLPKILESIKLEEQIEPLSIITGMSLHAANDKEQAKLLDKYYSLGNNPNNHHMIGGNLVNLAENAACYGFSDSFATALQHGYKVTPDLMFDICDPHQTGQERFLANNLDVLRLALQQKPDLTIRDEQGRTILHRVKDSNAQTLLINAGADIHTADNTGNKPNLTLRNQLISKIK